MGITTLGYAATLGGTRIWVMSFSEGHTGTTLGYAAALGGTWILAMPSSSGLTYHINTRATNDNFMIICFVTNVT